MLTIDSGLLAALLSHFTHALPNEGCVLLSGTASQVTRIWPITNVAASPTRFVMDPTQQVDAMLAIHRQGQTLLAIAHSHPTGPAVPSPTDLAEAHYPGVLHLIATPHNAGWQVNAFRYADDQATAVAVTVLAASHGETIATTRGLLR